MIYYILCFLKASIKLKVKVVPKDIFKFGGERVNDENNDDDDNNKNDNDYLI